MAGDAGWNVPRFPNGEREREVEFHGTELLWPVSPGEGCLKAA